MYQFRHLLLGPTLHRRCWIWICISLLWYLRPLLHDSCCTDGHVWQVVATEGCLEVEAVAREERRVKLRRQR